MRSTEMRQLAATQRDGILKRQVEGKSVEGYVKILLQRRYFISFLGYFVSFCSFVFR